MSGDADRPPARLAGAILIAGLTIGSYRQLDPDWSTDDNFDPIRTIVRNADELVANATAGRPALVLFRWHPQTNVHAELVYNPDVPFPDMARAIRAHDLGPTRNPTLFRYYATLQPDRTVYRYDRATDTLAPLGNVKDLASSPSPSHNPRTRL